MSLAELKSQQRRHTTLSLVFHCLVFLVSPYDYIIPGRSERGERGGHINNLRYTVEGGNIIREKERPIGRDVDKTTR